MILVVWLKVLIAGYLMLQSSNAFTQRSKGYCFYGHVPLHWWEAKRACNEKGTELICYSTEQDLLEIVESFIDMSSRPSINIWLSKRNCKPSSTSERCLSLNIGKRGDRVWQFYQKLCDQRLTFICCSQEIEDHSTISTTDSSTTSTDITTSTYRVSETSHEPTSTAKRYSHSSTESSTGTSLHCQSIHKNGINWPKTQPGLHVFMPCSGNSIGNVTWMCNISGVWEPDNPDASQCQSVEILNIEDKFNSTSAHETISALEKVSYDGEDFHEKDLSSVVSMMSLLPDRLYDEVSLLPEDERWEVMQNSVSKSVSIIDSVMDLNNIWTNINAEERLSMGSNILRTVDNFGVFLADIMTSGNELNILKKNLAIKVQKIDSDSGVSELSWQNFRKGSKDGITLDKGYDRNVDSKMGDLTVVFTHYTSMNVLLATSHQSKDAMDGDGILNSAVVSAVLAQHLERVKVDSDVRIAVDHLTPEPNDTVCVFWDYQRNQWDTTGCKLERGNDSYSVCVCDHLTNFAVLMDFQGRIEDVDGLPFFYITVIGCTISIVCLFFCIIIFTCYSCHNRNVWGLRYTIHRNLCLTLFVANLVLVIGLNKTENQVVCAVVAGLLHYFFLSAFCWMFLEGFHIYLMLVVVFASKRSHWEKYYFFGYGIPLIVVGITAVLQPDGYGSDKVCWLSVEKGVIWSFTGPVACILAVNLCALILAHWKANKISTKGDSNSIQIIRRWLRVTVILFPILGITWLFGFLYFGKRFKVMAYTFSALNSLQGLCIFICHCVLDTKARSMVLASIKKKQASVATDVSGSQKKSKDRRKSKSLEDKLPETKDELNKELRERSGSERRIPDVLKNTWNVWQRPWTFNFRFQVSERSERNHDGEYQEKTPTAVAFQWNKISAAVPL